MHSYQNKENLIYPLPSFVTKETSNQVEAPADEQDSRSLRTLDEWERETMANMNRMAADEQYRREIAARQS